jgi:arabinofuranosyltransferase
VAYFARVVQSELSAGECAAFESAGGAAAESSIEHAPAAPVSPNTAFLRVALVAGGGSLLAVTAYVLSERFSFGLQGIDDANIFFVYARNLLAGRGAVYAPDGPPVEGFSSPLWLAICTLASALPGGPAPWLLALSLLASIASMVCIVRVQERQLALLGLERRCWLASAGTLLWVGSSPLFCVWQVLSLMDTAILTLCVSAALLIVTAPEQKRAARQLAVLTPALVLARPEGFLWAFGAAACLALGALVQGSAPRTAWALARTPGLATLGTLALGLGVRRWIFGSWVANAVLAKQSIGLGARFLDGCDNLVRWFAHHPPLVLLAPFAFPLVWLLARRRVGARQAGAAFARFESLGPTWFAAAFLLAGVLLPVVSGGDHFGGFRLFQPAFLIFSVPLVVGAALLPELILSSNEGAERSATKRWAARSLPVILLVLPFSVRPSSWRGFDASNRPRQRLADLDLAVGSEFWIAQTDREHGERLTRIFRGDLPHIGYAAAGGIGVGYAGSVIDLMGLNQPELARSCGRRRGPKAHACFDADIFFQLSPEALLPRALPQHTPVTACATHLRLARKGNWDNTIFRGIFTEPRFLDAYVLATVRRAGVNDVEAQGYFRRDFVSHLARDSSYRVSVTPWEECHV